MRSLSKSSVVLFAALALGVTLGGQQPLPAAAAAGGRAGRGGRGDANAQPNKMNADPAEIAHGQQVFQANCSFCHGSDARGATAPNLIRDQLVLDDKGGDLITAVVHGSRQDLGMPKFDLADSDIVAIAAWLHSQPLGNRGAPTDLDILVGNAQAGEAYFNGAGKCSTCHSVTGDLAGIGGKYSPKVIQNAIVSGRAAGGRGGFGGGGGAAGKPTTVTVTLPNGTIYNGRLDHYDAFTVSLTDDDGVYRSFDINGDSPKIAVHDPLQPHLDMLMTWKDSDIHNLTAYLATVK